MKKLLTIIASALIMSAFVSCDKEDDKAIDTEKPQINASIDGASPANAATFYFGEEIPVKLLLTDNAELGSFSVNIHNNFDHHSHSTEEEGEEHHDHEEGEEHHHHEGEDGDAFQFTQDYTIPAGSLNGTNPTARYRLPENIHLTDDQIKAINKNENGITAGFKESDPEYQKYLGAEAIEGDRTPDELLSDSAQEYISAIVMAENVYKNDKNHLLLYLIPYFLLLYHLL